MGQEGSKASKLSKKDIKAYQDRTGFNKVELKTLLKAFEKESKNGKLDREGWKQVLVVLEKNGLKENLASDPFSDDLFDVVDVNNDGFVDQEELLSGLSLICNGTPEDKIDLMFKMWDTNNDQTLDMDELMTCFEKCYKSAILILLNDSAKKDELGPEKVQELARDLGRGLASQVSKQIFDQMDEDKNGVIDKSEFARIFSHGGLKITASVEGQEFNGFMGFFDVPQDAQ